MVLPRNGALLTLSHAVDVMECNLRSKLHTKETVYHIQTMEVTTLRVLSLISCRCTSSQWIKCAAWWRATRNMQNCCIMRGFAGICSSRWCPAVGWRVSDGSQIGVQSTKTHEARQHRQVLFNSLDEVGRILRESSWNVAAGPIGSFCRVRRNDLATKSS